jgi:hypothetical protein
MTNTKTMVMMERTAMRTPVMRYCLSSSALMDGEPSLTGKDSLTGKYSSDDGSDDLEFDDDPSDPLELLLFLLSN